MTKKPPQINFTQCDLTNVSKSISADLHHHFRFRLVECTGYIVKTRQIVASIVMTSQFHKFSDVIFGGFFVIWNLIQRGQTISAIGDLLGHQSLMYLKLSNVDQPIFDGINVTFERKVQDIWSLKEGQEISEGNFDVLN